MRSHPDGNSIRQEKSVTLEMAYTLYRANTKHMEVCFLNIKRKYDIYCIYVLKFATKYLIKTLNSAHFQKYILRIDN